MNAYHEDLESVINEARNHEVRKILVPGIDLKSSRAAIQLAEQYEGIYAAVGVHPHDAKEWEADWLPQFDEMANHPKVMAIGEIGLDFYRNLSPPDIQKKVFQMQLELSIKKNLPVILHERNSADELWPMLKNMVDSNSTALLANWGVLHSFSGPSHFAQAAIQIGLLIGISGPVTYANAVEKQQMTVDIPLEKMILETDGPFLSPHPFRGKRNLPQYIPLIAEKIANLKQCSLEQVRDTTTINANSLFIWRSDP